MGTDAAHWVTTPPRSTKRLGVELQTVLAATLQQPAQPLHPVIKGAWHEETLLRILTGVKRIEKLVRWQRSDASEEALTLFAGVGLACH